MLSPCPSQMHLSLVTVSHAKWSVLFLSFKILREMCGKQESMKLEFKNVSCFCHHRVTSGDSACISCVLRKLQYLNITYPPISKLLPTTSRSSDVKLTGRGNFLTRSCIPCVLRKLQFGYNIYEEFSST